MTKDSRPAARRKAPDATDEPAAPQDNGDRQADRPGREPGELVVAMSPRQILGGFALLAGLIIMLRRRGRDRERD